MTEGVGDPEEQESGFMGEALGGAEAVAEWIGENVLGAAYFDAAAKAFEGSESVAAASQSLYWSTQAFKVDLSAITAAYDVIKADETGITVAGIPVFRFPWVNWGERRYEQRLQRRRERRESRRNADRGESAGGDTEEARGTRGAADSWRSEVSSAALLNRQVFGYREESERSFRRIKEIHSEAKAFREDIEGRTSRAAEEFARIVRTIDQALAGP